MKGLSGQFAADYPAWHARLGALFQQLDDVPLTILLFGPGRRANTTDKRQEIADHLRGQSALNEAITSEELIATDPNFQGMHPYNAELLHIYAADIVLVLVTERATGSQAGIGTFWHDSDFRKKAYLITPKLTQKERRKRQKKNPYLSQGWLGYPLERQFQYTDDEYRDCTKIRGHCNEIVNRARHERGFARLRESKSRL